MLLLTESSIVEALLQTSGLMFGGSYDNISSIGLMGCSVAIDSLTSVGLSVVTVPVVTVPVVVDFVDLRVDGKDPSPSLSELLPELPPSSFALSILKLRLRWSPPLPILDALKWPLDLFFVPPLCLLTTPSLNPEEAPPLCREGGRSLVLERENPSAVMGTEFCVSLKKVVKVGSVVLGEK